MSLEELSSKLDQFSDAQLKASEAIFHQLGHTTVKQSAETPGDSAEGPLVQLLQDVQASLENRFDALSEVMSLDRGQRDQEIRSLYASSQASVPYRTPASGSPMYGSPQYGTRWAAPEHRRPPSNAGSFDMASICSSLSSIAASLSALPRQYGSLYSGMQPQKDDNAYPEERRRPLTEWTCDALSGIDDARYPSEEDPQLELCLFCGKGFMMKTLDDTYLFGEHLVYEHSFGKCDLDESFGSWGELQHHLEQFHRAGNFEATCSTSSGRNGLLRFERRITFSSSGHPYFSDASGRSLPGLSLQTADAFRSYHFVIIG